MFTEKHRQLTLQALDDKVASINRASGKQPRFKPVYDQDIAELREAQVEIRNWTVTTEEKKK